MAEIMSQSESQSQIQGVDGIDGNDSSSLILRNELAGSSSPYLRAHKDNPVAWQEWGSKAIDLAKQYEKMIFLSIGYNSCHWCHVMERESFSSIEVANVLNNEFIPIKLDRESRPDLDDIYMNYVTATTGSGGWPLNVFLTPSLQPVFGGTYWPGPSSGIAPPSDTDDKPLTFLDILFKMRDIWRDERERCLQSAAGITKQLQAFAAEGTHSHNTVHVRGENEDDTAEPLDLDLLDDAVDHFISRYDPQYGGFSPSPTAPKFPTPTNLTLLLRIGASINKPSTHTRFGFPSPIPAILGRETCITAASMAVHTLLAMSRSALRDHLGHGFHRYSVIRNWNLPHFEKMIDDNAQLLSAYCDAWALGRDPEILGTIYDLVEYFTDPASPIVSKNGGGWYSSEDADSRPTSASTTNSAHQDSKEGAYYVWTLKELQKILGDRDAGILARHFGVEEHGNVPAQNDVNDEFINHNVLYIAATPSVLAKEFGLKEDEVVRVIKEGRTKLKGYREHFRGQPTVDDKVICSWNGLVISALARAANTLATIDESRAMRCREAAVKAVNFIKSNMFNESTGKLTRIYTSDTTDESRDLAFIDDYAYLTHALIKLYDITMDPAHMDLAFQLQATLDRDFYAGSSSGAYLQAARHVSDSTNNTTDQIFNLKPGTDNSLPSPNGLIAQNLLYLASYASSFNPSSTAEPEELRRKAQSTIDTFAPEIIQHPFLYVSLLAAVVLDQVGVKSLIVPESMSESDIEARRLRGFGRTVARIPGGRDGEVMICGKDGVCRVLRDGELEEEEDVDDGFGGGVRGVDNTNTKNDAGGVVAANDKTTEPESEETKKEDKEVPIVSPEVIEEREKQALKEDEERKRRESSDRSFPVVVDLPPPSSDS